MRTRHLRQSVHLGTDYLLDRLVDLMADADAFVALIERRIVNDPQWLREMVLEEMRKKRAAGTGHPSES